MLDSYRPNAGMTFVRNPGYFVPGLPYIDRVEMTVDEDNASRMAAFMSGKYDLGWEYMGAVNRTDWVQIKDTLKTKRPQLRTQEFPVAGHVPHLDAHRPEALQRRPRAPGHLAGRRPQGHHRRRRRGRGGAQPAGAGRPPRLVDPLGPARRGGEVLPVRPRRGQATARRRRLSQWLPRHRLLHHLRLDDPGRHHDARPEAAQGRRHRRQARPEGVRRLHLVVLLRQRSPR